MHLHFRSIILCVSMWPLLAFAAEFHGMGGPPAGRLAQAYDPATLDKKQRDYLDSVADEAAKTSAAVSAAPEAESPEPQETASPAAPKTYKSRTDEIKSIVEEAAAAPTREESVTEPPATSQRPAHRQELREVVRGALSATDTPNDSYVSKIRQEGEITVTEDEAKAVTDPSKAPERFSVYTVRPGDSLWLISERVYGDGYKWLEIFRANASSVADEDQLTVGQELRIPGL